MSKRSTRQRKPRQRKLGVRPTTYDTFRAIAKDRHWSLAETADVLASEYRSRMSPVNPVEPSDAQLKGR